MSTTNPIREGFWKNCLAATERHVEAQNGAMATTPLTQERDLKRVERLGEYDGLAYERVMGQSDLIDLYYLQEGLDVARTVGCIRLMDRLGRELGAATGVMVSSQLLLTNHHVLRSADDAAFSTVWFDYEKDGTGAPRSPKIFRLEPHVFFHTDEALDFSLVAVEEVGHDGEHLESFGSMLLIQETPKVASHEAMTIIQHPLGGFKQIALRENYLSSILEEFLQYSTDTQPGSSGSPVFNDQWEIVALHHAGVMAKDDQGRIINKDGDIWEATQSEDAIQWIGNEGVRISRICAHLKAQTWSEDEQDFIDELFEHEEGDPLHLAPSGHVPLENVAVGEGDHGHETPIDTSGVVIVEPVPEIVPPVVVTPPWEKSENDTPDPVELRDSTEASEMTPPPLPISYLDGETATATSEDLSQIPPPLPVSETELPAEPDPSLVPPPIPVEAPSFDLEAHVVGGIQEEQGMNVASLSLESFSHLTGFNETFLGARTPLPRMLPAMKQQVVKSSQGIEVLDYTHFSIVMNGRRRLAFFTAVNIDGNAEVKIHRTSDVWLFDPRLDRQYQIGPELYAGNELDRGHLVRREDPNWGPDAARANADTFHFTNCSPQHTKLNTVTWLGLENYILRNTQNHDLKVTVYTGPVLKMTDPIYRGVQIPMEFWKVVAFAKQDGALSVTAYKQSQKALVAGMGVGTEEEFVFGEYATYQVKVTALEALTGLDFGSLRSSDPLGGVEATGVDSREITSHDQIVL